MLPRPRSRYSRCTTSCVIHNTDLVDEDLDSGEIEDEDSLSLSLSLSVELAANLQRVAKTWPARILGSESELMSVRMRVVLQHVDVLGGTDCVLRWEALIRMRVPDVFMSETHSLTYITTLGWKINIRTWYRGRAYYFCRSVTPDTIVVAGELGSFLQEGAGDFVVRIFFEADGVHFEMLRVGLVP